MGEGGGVESWVAGLQRVQLIKSHGECQKEEVQKNNERCAMLFHHEQISLDSRTSKYYTVRRLLLGRKNRLTVSHGHWCVAVELAMQYSLI